MTAYAVRLENGTDTKERMRQADTLHLFPEGALSARNGLRRDGGGEVTVVAGTMQVEVSPASGWVNGGVSDAQGGYPTVSDAVVALTLSDGHATLERTDTVVMEVQDDIYDGSGFTQASVRIVEGTAGAGAPALPTSCIPLRDVIVPAGLSAGTGGLSASNLDADRRTYVVASGGILPVASATERDSLSVQPGAVVFRADTNTLEAWSGTAWDKIVKDQPRAGLIAASGTPTLGTSTTQVTLASTSHNTGMTVGSSGITVPQAGLYVVKGSLLFNAGTSGRRAAILRVNGATVEQAEGGGSAELVTAQVSAELTLAAGDVVTLWAFQSSGGGSLTIRNDIAPARLSVRRVGD